MTRREIATTLILLAQESGLSICVDCFHQQVAVRRRGVGLPFAWVEWSPHGDLIRIELRKKRATTKRIEEAGVPMLPYDDREKVYSLIMSGKVGIPLLRLLSELLEMAFHENAASVPKHWREI